MWKNHQKKRPLEQNDLLSVVILHYLLWEDVFHNAGHVTVHCFHHSCNRAQEDTPGLQEDAEEEVRLWTEDHAPTSGCFLVVGWPQSTERLYFYSRGQLHRPSGQQFLCPKLWWDSLWRDRPEQLGTAHWTRINTRFQHHFEGYFLCTTGFWLGSCVSLLPCV